MRLFVGIPLEDEIHAALSVLLPELAQRLPSCRWVNPDNLHLTLRFLGEVPETGLPEVRHWFQQNVSAGEFKPLKLAGTGCFKHRGRMVFWCGVRAGGWLAELADRLSGPVTCVPAEHRPFVPHLTLGRYRMEEGETAQVAEFQKAFNQWSLPRAQQTKVRVVLYESQLTPTGSVYGELMACGAPQE